MSELYRRISVRMWGDADFRALSGPQPNARDLWIYLLTGPHTTAIPGLFSATRGDLAERLGWPMEGFLKAFAELFPERSTEQAGKASQKPWLKADWDAQVVWIPNAVYHNEPENPNVLKSWRHAWRLIPECPLKDEAYSGLKAFAEGKSKGFAKAFHDTFGKDLREGVRKAFPKQKQEHEQKDLLFEKIPTRAPARAGGSARVPSDADAPPGFAEPSRLERSKQPVADHIGFSAAFERAAKALGFTAAPSLTLREQTAAAEHVAKLAANRPESRDQVAYAVSRAALQGAQEAGKPALVGSLLRSVDPWAPAVGQGAARPRPGRVEPAPGTTASDFSDVSADEFERQLNEIGRPL